MYFQQLKILLWRNFILKKRSLLSTILEITVPSISIIILGLTIGKKEVEGIFHNINNLESKNIENESLNLLLPKIEFDFVFPSHFDNKVKNNFLENFKSNKYLNEYKSVESSQFFSNYTDESLNDEYNYENEIDNDYEMLINVYNKVIDMTNHHKVYKDYNNKISSFGIIFESITKYTLQFDLGKDIYDYLKLITDEDLDALENTFGIQLMIDKAIMKTLADTHDNYQEFDIYKTKMIRNEYKFSYKIRDFKEYISYFMVYYYVPLIFSLLNNLVIEKESKIKESLVIIGLKKSAFWLSWAIIYSIIILICTIFVIISMYFLNIFTTINYGILMIILIVYGISCCCIGFLLSTLFKKTKTSNISCIIILIAFFGMILTALKLENSKTFKAIVEILFSPNYSILW
eukprot:jgi/Orpsp1_1/1185629/evm.model.c7180000094675.1